jgi:hypothetical protein
MRNKNESMPLGPLEATNEPKSIDRLDATLRKFGEIRDKAMALYKRNIEIHSKWESLLADELTKPANAQDAQFIANVEAKIANAERVEKQLNDIILDAFETINVIERALLDLIYNTS